MIKKTLLDGVAYSFIETNRFKTSVISVGFYLPLGQENAANSLALSIMKSGTKELPDLYSFNRKLASLYGATVSASTSKNGDCLEMRLNLTVNSDRFSLNGEKTSTEAGKLLCDMVFDRYFANDLCSDEIFAREKRLLSEKIINSLNEKRTYAKSKCEELMCKEEPYGTALNGTLEDVNSLTKQKVADALKTIVEKSFVSVIVISDSEPHEFVEAFSNRISSVNRCYNPLPKNTVRAAGELRTQDEEMPVAQGKLVLGLRSCNTGTDRETIPTFVMTYLYGGGPSGKLFLNVREKLSLCYYCAARTVRNKGVMFVDSGVELSNMDAAKTAILKEFDDMKQGNFSDKDLEFAKLSLIDSIRSFESDLPTLLSWYSARALDGDGLTTTEAAELISKVSREDVIKSANTFSLDSIYRLLPDGSVKED